MTPVLTVPGIGNSGPAHWQTLWERMHPTVSRVQQQDWDRPACDAWVAAIEQAWQQRGPAIVVAHSLGCLAVVHWMARHRRAVPGLLLVAVPDPAGPAFPPLATGFEVLPPELLGTPPVLVSSADDPYASPAFTARCVAAWGAQHVALGAAGHINASSGLGPWPAGWALVQHWRPA